MNRYIFFLSSWLRKHALEFKGGEVRMLRGGINPGLGGGRRLKAASRIPKINF